MARVLVVDDSPLVVRFVEHTLAADGHEVQALDSFVRLAATVREDPPDLILLDLNIPALSGVIMGKLVRSYQARDIPIIVYSSEAPAKLQAAALEVGAHSYLQKSDDAGALRRTVDQVLRARLAADL